MGCSLPSRQISWLFQFLERRREEQKILTSPRFSEWPSVRADIGGHRNFSKSVWSVSLGYLSNICYDRYYLDLLSSGFSAFYSASFGKLLSFLPFSQKEVQLFDRIPPQGHKVGAPIKLIRD